jgi:glutathione S-transferase
MLGMGGWPALERWFAAMDSRGTYAGMKSDFYTHCHDLPPQLGGCAFNQDGPAVAAQIDGTKPWRRRANVGGRPRSSHSIK